MTNQYWRLSALAGAAAAVTLSGAAACSDSFAEDCHANHTCVESGGGTASGATAGDGGQGQGNDAPVGGAKAAAGDTRAGGDAGGMTTAMGGQGGEPSTVGMVCTKDADCDDHDSCTGTETCVNGVCAAGTSIECPAGLVCSAANHDACVFKSAAPWIVYAADADTVGVNDVYGVKVDLLGTMKPVKLSPTLAAGWSVYGTVQTWSPDGTGAIITTTDMGAAHVESYLVRFGDGLPAAAVQLTKGMPASTFSVVEWSPTGKSLSIERSDGLHVVDIAATGEITQARVSPDGYDQVKGWLKNDNEAVYIGRSALTTTTSVALAVRNGGGWTRHPLVADIGGSPSYVTPSPDRSLLGYVIINPQTGATVWTLETTEGSSPTHVAGPALDVALFPAPDLGQYILATTDKTSFKTTVFGGPLSTLSAPPILKQNLTINATTSLGLLTNGPWAPDSSRAAVFQDGTYGKQLVMYEPGATEKWLALPETQAVSGGDASVWAPNSKTLAMTTRTSATSAVQLTLIAVPGYAKRDVDLVPFPGGFAPGPFSPDSGLFVYTKGTAGYYIDLSKGVAAAPDPIAIPGAMGNREFATTGTDFVYIRGSEACFYVDFSGGIAAEPVRVNDAGTVTFCGFQKLPR